MAPSPQEHPAEEPQVSQIGRSLSPDDIVISGMSGIFANCNNVQELFEKLYAKVDLTANEQPRWNYEHPEAPKYVGIAPDLGKFDAQFFKVHRKLGCATDVMARKLLEHAYQAVYDSGSPVAELHGKKVGVFVGAAFSDHGKNVYYETSSINSLSISGGSRSMFANRISYWLDSKGPSIAIDASCSSSMVALEMAYDYMKRGLCDAAIVGGSNLCFHPHVSVHYNRLGLLCEDGKTRSFDKNASGAVRADGISCLFLQKAKSAKRVYAKIIHVKSQYNIEKDAVNKEQKYGPMRPRNCLVEFWNDFYREAAVPPQKVEYVEAYGAALPEADLEELNAIGQVFCKGTKRPLRVGSVMSNIGYTEAASGVGALTKVLLAYHSGQIAANLHYETPHDQVEAIREGQMEVVVENKPFDRTYTAVNSQSCSGLNCHTLLGGYHKEKDITKYKTNIPYLVSVSGRIESSVIKLLDHLKSKHLDAEEIGLLHNIHRYDIKGHLARGYTILDTNEEGQTVSLSENCVYYPDLKRPVWFVYSGMGSQWAGMGAQLMRIPIFASAVEKCHKVLEPKGINLMKVLVEPDKAIFDNILNSFIGIAAVQIGLTDVLRELGIEPDNIIGHSLGELGCAYADGCFTAEEMILSAYSRGMVSVNTPFIRGVMAAVGLGYRDIVDLCPPEVEVACHNGPDSSTISGPEDVMRAFVKELTDKGIFAKEVPCSNIAFHSRYVAKAGPALLHYLKEVIKDPKPRSQKWVSTSVPQDRWDEPGAKYSSAEYHTNNLLSSVLFEETLRLIPNDAVVIEIAPHGLLQAILKRSLEKNCVNVPLTRRGHPDAVVFLLENIGKLYQAGLTPELQVLYPKIEFPVSTGTPMLSHLVEWMHRENWPFPNYTGTDYRTAGRRAVLVAIHDEEYKYITGNVRNECTMFPEAGVLVLVWETLAMLLDKKLCDLSVRFRDVRFDSDVIMTDDEVSAMDVTIQKGSGKFEVTNNGNAVASGFILQQAVRNRKMVLESNAEYLMNNLFDKSTEEYLTSSEIYKLFYVRGYSYSGSFRSIYKSNVDFTTAEVIWNENWVTFVDSLLQLNTLRRHHSGVSKIKRIREIVINPEKHRLLNTKKQGEEIRLGVRVSDLGVNTRCGGVFVQDITFNDISTLQKRTITKTREFIPYHPFGVFDVNTVAHVFLQIVAENCTDGHINAIEFAEDHGRLILGDVLEEAALEFTTAGINYRCKVVESTPDMKTANDCNVVIGYNLLKDKKIQKHLINLLDQQFIISLEENGATSKPFVEIAAMRTSIGCLVLGRLRITEEKIKHISFISIPKNICHRSFMEQTRSKMLPMQRIVLIADMPPPSELVALIQKWRSEPEKNNLNLIITDSRTDSNCSFNEQLSKNLAINMYKNGNWGSEFYIPISGDDGISLQTRLCSTTPGDLESLTWVEAPKQVSPKSVKVHYAGLTHHDVMKAIGARPGTTQNDSYGMDFSGITDRGERVMGVVACGALASAVAPDEELLWPVPAHWTLEDAATVPQPYTHAYYCLKIRSDLKNGSSILVHCGAGALGQAIISIALGMGCEVFTTVSSMNKKRFLKSLFPELQDDHIGNSRDISFRSLVMDRTDNKGCDLVFSCLNGNLEEASMECVKGYGLFVNTSISNCYENESFGMYRLEKVRDYTQVNFSLIFEYENVQIKKDLRRLVSEGIVSGQVRPLTRLVLGGREAPRAARLLAAGAHRGRLLLTPEHDATQLRMSLSASASYAVVCGDHELGLELVDRLIERGARNLMVRYDAKKEPGYLKAKFSFRRSAYANVKITPHSLRTYEDTVSYLSGCAELGDVEGIFVVDESGHIEGQTTVVEHLDGAARELCPTLKHFVVLRPAADRAELRSQSVCDRRRLEGLPALYLSMPNLAKFDQPNVINQTVSNALDALETSLRLGHRNVVTYATKEEPRCDLLEKVGDILSVNLRAVPYDTTLQSLGLDFEKAKEVENVLERRYKYSCSRQNLSDVTVARLNEVESKMSGFVKKKPTKLEVYFRYVDTDELMSSAELLAMPTLVYAPRIKNDEFLSKEKYLILVPGMEGHYGVFSRLCERLKIFALCMQPGVDNPCETPRQTAQRFVKKIIKMVELKQSFYLLGYSYGVLIAMEMAALLEQKGLQGTIFCVDSAPDVFTAQLNATLGDISESVFQNTVIDHMYTVMAGRSSEELRQRLADIPSWVEKVDLAWRHLQGLVKYSSQYARNCMKTAYGRIVEAKKYSSEHLQRSPLRSKVVLMRSRRQPEALTAHPRDFGLSKYTRQPVEVYDLEKEHADVMEDLRCTNIVHKHLDPCLLEDYSRRNHCETYSIDETTFLDVSEDPST